MGLPVLLLVAHSTVGLVPTAGHSTRGVHGGHLRHSMLSSAKVPRSLLNGEWALPPALDERDGQALMERVLSWLPGMLVALDLGEDPDEGEEAEERDSEFVDTARPWLHTKAFGVIKAPSQPEIAGELWEEMLGAQFLKEEGGSLLLLVPAAANDIETFSGIVAAVRTTARDHINEDVVVTGLHPESVTGNVKCPVPTIMLFLDNEELFVDGGSMRDISSLL
ncbi:hypothetical protein AB1Y20_021267 [Prymnesium parvum]|uniref:Uncharacterized protein n=1 Tax=Prymnesium parvum TaxID=97485 RepID=A0AB34JKU3_PRYPA